MNTYALRCCITETRNIRQQSVIPYVKGNDVKGNDVKEKRC